MSRPIIGFGLRSRPGWTHAFDHSPRVVGFCVAAGCVVAGIARELILKDPEPDVMNTLMTIAVAIVAYSLLILPWRSPR